MERLYLSANSSSAAHLPSISPTLLEAFLPGYSIISHFLYSALGFDITLIVSASLITFAVIRSVLFLCRQLSQLIQTYWMSVVVVESDDEIYDAIIDWMRDQPKVRNALSLIAKTDSSRAANDDLSATPSSNTNPSPTNTNYWSNKSSIIYEPSLGMYWLWHRNNYLRIDRELNPQSTGLEGVTPLKNKERLSISLVRCSTGMKS